MQNILLSIIEAALPSLQDPAAGKLHRFNQANQANLNKKNYNFLTVSAAKIIIYSDLMLQPT